MFCPKCGKETDASGKYCQWCGADIEVVAPKQAMSAEPEEEETPQTGNYAGLGRRFAAFIIDMIILLIFEAIVSSVFVVASGFDLVRGLQNLYFFVFKHAPIEELTQAGTKEAFIFSAIAAYGIILIVIPWLYFAGFECSRGQATPGKTLLRIVVTDRESNRISFARATLRFFAKFISALIIFIGFIMIGLTKKRQGLHDRIAGCLVLLPE